MEIVGVTITEPRTLPPVENPTPVHDDAPSELHVKSADSPDDNDVGFATKKEVIDGLAAFVIGKK